MQQLVHDPKQCRLGKRRPKPKADPRDLKLGHYLRPELLPPLPKNVDWGKRVADWLMLGNDQYGDCVAEGTLVSAKDIKTAYRAPYSGPLIEIKLRSGKSLTVTPNHAVLTPQGFLRAKTLQKGDYLIGTRGAQVLTGTGRAGVKLDVDNSPSKIEEIFAACSVRKGMFRKAMSPTVDFHGDAIFFDGDVDVVWAKSFLGREFYTPLGKPKTQHKVGYASQLKGYFHSASSAFERSLRRRTPSFYSVGVGSEGASFSYTDTSVTQTSSLSRGSQGVPGGHNSLRDTSFINPKSLGNLLHSFPSNVFIDGLGQIARSFGVKQSTGFLFSSKFNASGLHPSLDGVPTDPQLPGNIINAFPGFVEADCVIDINVKTINHGFVYDLSVGKNWYIANGIIVHNCTCAAVGHAVMGFASNTGRVFAPTVAQVLSLYTIVTGEEGAAFNPITGVNDNGCFVADVLKEWRTNGFVGHALGAYASVRPRRFDLVRAAIDLFGAVDIGIALPIAAQSQEVWHVTDSKLRGDAAPGSWGGHSVILTAYSPNTVTCVTWGQPKYITWSWLYYYCDEIWALLSPDWVSGGRPAPSGFNLAQLQADLNDVTA